MKFPVSMLKEFVSTKLDAQQIGDLLTMAGFELEGIEEVEGEAVLDIKVVSNRGDGLSVFGLSREVLAKDPSSQPTEHYAKVAKGYVRGDESSTIPALAGKVAINTNHCTRFACRMFDGVTNGPSPEWMQKRIRQMGMRPISLFVDVTNYVMVELGQPLHAYDYPILSDGQIQVRQAEEGEVLVTLNGDEHVLRPHNMVIADASRAIGAAGVMGGQNTEVSAATSQVLLEAAHFVNTSVRKTRKELGLSTDASYRFERSVDPNGVVRALNRVADLVEDAIGSSVTAAGVVDLFPAPPIAGSVPIRVSRANSLMGYEGEDLVSTAQAKSYLERLGFEVGGEGEPFIVTSPSWRPDIEREEDLVEEIGRIHGYERIPERGPIGETPIGGTFGLEAMRETIAEHLMRMGFVQTISHSLRDTHRLQSTKPLFGPRNPGSPEHAYLRNSLLPSLADASNINGNRDLQLFELGTIHTMEEGSYVEFSACAMLSVGALTAGHWVKTPPAVADFFSMKAAVEAVGRAAERPLSLKVPTHVDARLHPTRQAEIVAGANPESREVVGIMGQVHPDVAAACGLAADTLLAEINLDALHLMAKDAFVPRVISRNPAVSRDISVLMPVGVPFDKLDSACRSALIQAGQGIIIEKFELIDVYTGKGIEPGFHSLTISFTIRKMGQNLTDEEANQVRESVVRALGGLGGAQR